MQAFKGGARQRLVKVNKLTSSLLILLNFVRCFDEEIQKDTGRA